MLNYSKKDFGEIIYVSVCIVFRLCTLRGVTCAQNIAIGSNWLNYSKTNKYTYNVYGLVGPNIQNLSV